MDTQRSTVVGVFANRSQADRAIDELRREGFQNDQLGVVGPKGEESTTGKHADKGAHVAEGAVVGAVAGAGVGGLVGLGILAGVIPVIGPAIAAGTLGTILLNAAGGAAIAGVAGALVGLGIPEEEASYYEGELTSGRYLLTVHAGAREPEARAILRRQGAYTYQDRPVATMSPAGAGRGTRR
jgi:hypothetical protein